MAHLNDTPLSSKQVYLNSRNAHYRPDNHSSAIFYFNEDVSPPANVSTLVSIVNFTCPVSYYVFTSNNNRIYYSVGSGSTVYFDFPLGNYNASEVASGLKNLGNFVTDCVYIKSSNKFRMTHTSSSFTVYSTSTCLEQLGFSGGANHVSSTVYGIHTLVSDNAVNLSGTSSLYIMSNMNSPNYDSRVNGSLGTLCRIPVDTDRNGILHYAPTIPFYSVSQNKSIDYFVIRIEDDARNPVDFNGLHWALTLQFDFQYTKEFKPVQTMMKKPLLPSDLTSDKV